MGNDYWEGVLLQWINCLNLESPIEEIDALKSSDFFYKFLLLLSNVQAPDNPNNLQIIYDLLEKTYLDYNFDKIFNIEQLRKENLIEICSLLLHYSCVIEQNDKVINPLCQLLLHKTQLCIRTFLETVTTKVTHQTLQQIINKCAPADGNNSESPCLSWPGIGDSPTATKSPLQDFLETPLRRSTRIIEKDKELKRLREKLAIESYDKADLQEEVVKCKEQLKKMEVKIKEKCKEITTLRSDLYSTENADGRNFKDDGHFKYIEKRLKLDIENLEKYTKQLEGEQELLQKENLAISGKLKLSNEEIKVLQANTVKLEDDHRDLQGKYSQQEIELANLKMHCNDLTSLLEEVNRKSHDLCDNSLSYSPARFKKQCSINYSVCEDLGQSIIEVQLRDSQKENFELKALLRESEEKSKQLHSEINDVKAKYEEVSGHRRDMENKNKELLFKISELANSNATLQDLVASSKEQILELTKSAQYKDSMILYLQESLEKTSVLNSEFEKSNKQFQHELKILEIETKSNKFIIEEKDNIYECLQSQTTILQNKHEKLFTDYKSLDVNLGSLQELYNKTMKEFELSLQKLSKLVDEDKNFIFEDKFEMFEAITQEIEKERDSDRNKMENLEMDISKCQDLCNILQEENRMLSEKVYLTRNERDKIETMLLSSEKVCKDLDKEIKLRYEEINNYSEKILEMAEFIVEFKNKTLKKDENSLGKLLDGVFHDIKKIKTDLSKKDEEINNNKMKFDELHKIKENLTKENIEKEKLYLEKIYVLESQIKDFKDNTEKLESNIEILDKSLAIKSEEIQELQHGKIILEENFEKVKADLEKKINITKDTQKKLEIEMQIITKEKSNLEVNVANLKTSLEALNAEKNTFLSENESLRGKHSQCLEALHKSEEIIQEKDTVNSKNNIELLNLKLEFESYRQQHKDLQNEIERIKQEENKYIFCIETLEIKNAEFETKLKQLNHEKDILKEVRGNLEKKNDDLERNLGKIVQELTIRNEELNDFIKELSLCKQENEYELIDVHSRLETAEKKLETVTSEQDDTIRKYAEEISTLKSELYQANNKIYDLNAKEVGYLQEIQIIKSELSTSFEKFAESFNAQQDLKSEQENQTKNLTENLHELVSNCNKLEKENKNNSEQIQRLSEELDGLKSEKITLEVKLSNQYEKYEQELVNTREHFQSDISNLTNRENTLKQQLAKAECDLEHGRGIRYRLDNEIKKLTSNLRDVQQEKSYLKERFALLESTKNEVDLEYDGLKLLHEKYIFDSELNLKKTEEELGEEIQSLKVENQKLHDDYSHLQRCMELLTTENEEVTEKKEITVRNLTEEIQTTKEKLSNLELLNSTIAREQEVLERNARKMQLEIEKHVEENDNHNSVLSKLQCAYDILQTGKERVEIDLENLNKEKEKLEKEKCNVDLMLTNRFKLNEEEIVSLKVELEQKNKIIKEKDQNLASKLSELKELQEICNRREAEKLVIGEQLQTSKQLHKTFLTQIDEENLKAIGDMTFDFMELKVTYENVYQYIKKLENEKEKLEKTLEDDITTRKTLQESLDTYEELLNKEKIKSSAINETLLEERKRMEMIMYELKSTISDFEKVKNDKLEHEDYVESLSNEIDNLTSERNDILEVRKEVFERKEKEIAKNHLEALDAYKRDLLSEVNSIKSDFIILKSGKKDLEEILGREKESKAFLEMKLLSLLTERNYFEGIYSILTSNMNKLSNKLINIPIIDAVCFENLTENDLRIISGEIEQKIGEVFGKVNEVNESMGKLEEEKRTIEAKLEFLEKEKVCLNADKEKLLSEYEEVSEERESLKADYEKEMLLLKEEIEMLKSNGGDEEKLKNENDILHQTIDSLKKNNIRAYNDYQKFLETSKTTKSSLDKLLKDRNTTETIINELKQKLISLQMKFIHLPQDFLYKQYFEQKEALEIITEDITRQFNRSSRVSFNTVCSYGALSEKVMHAVLSEKAVEIDAIFKDLEIEEIQNKIEEIKDRSADAIEQIASVEKAVDGIEIKNPKILKENTKMNAEFKNDEEYRRKYNALKQKLTLTENIKGNFEKKIKELREENRKLTLNENTDSHYRTLLEQHIETREGYERNMNETRRKNKELEEEVLRLKSERQGFEDEMKRSYERHLNDLKSKQTELEHDLARRGDDFESTKEIDSIKEAYGKLMLDNAKLNSDFNNLRKMYEDKNVQLKECHQIKEAYEKLLEENSHMITEVDTLKFKRNKDREDYLALLKKERDEHGSRESSSILQIRSEYETKLEAMKKKMINLYKEEVDSQMRKVQVERADNTVLLHTLEMYKTKLEEATRTINDLKHHKRDLSEARTTIEALRRRNSAMKLNEMKLSRESLGARSARSECDFRDFRTREVVECPRSNKRSSVHPVRTVVEGRKCATLPRSMEIIEEVNTMKRRVSVNAIELAADNLEMEDEGELFNNKYLADLREGRCAVGEGRESTSSRMSELAWRNSLVPPHLKSSYPAELQLIPPTIFKEDDIKAGNVDLDDSLNTRLLPTDKTRNKKDIGTTSYKKPGPPTPSKNGGRASLQGTTELPSREILRDHNEAGQSKRSTPNRIKQFFLGRTSIGRSNLENQQSSPKSKPSTKLFRKAR